MPMDQFAIGGSGPLGFPDAGGGAFFFGALEVFLAGPTTILSDTGSGQSLAEQLGGPLDPSQFTSQTASLNFQGNFVRGTVTSLVLVPEPSTALLVALGFVGIAVQRRRERAGARTRDWDEPTRQEG